VTFTSGGLTLPTSFIVWIDFLDLVGSFQKGFCPLFLFT
jgi:hypothetical protein